jgi:hypothetical protein
MVYVPGLGDVGSGSYSSFDYNGFPIYYQGTTTASAPVSSVSPTAVAVSTGVNPVETSYSLYGHTVPLSVFGVGRIGGEIIAGPWIENGLASFIISFGVPADPTGTRTLREIAFDSEVVWDSTSGFSTESFTYRFYGGTLTQGADALETTHFGADAIAYRPQILIAFENLPLANTKFKKIPYVAAVIADSSGDDVNLGEAFERLAYSPWVGYTSSQFETVGITDGLVSGGLIIAEQAEFLATIQQFGRFYPKWSILQTDKLRIVDRGDDVTPDIVLNRERLTNKVVLARHEPNSVPSILELSTIDPDADYTIVPSRAQSPRQPVAVTTSVKTDSAYLPAIMDADTRISLVTYAKHHEDRARKQISATAMAYGFEIEPGDYVGVAGLGTDFPGGETFRVLETLHGANYVLEFTAESILQCNVTSLTTPPPAGGGGTATTTWNPSDKSSASIVLSNGNLTATNSSGNIGGNGVRATTSRSSGKLYFEYTSGPWNSSSDFSCMGITTASQSFTNIGTSFGPNSLITFSDTSTFFNGSSAGTILGGSAQNSVWSWAIDLDNKKVWIRKNGGVWNNVGTQNPETNTGGIDISAVFTSNAAFPFFAPHHNAVLTANFGQNAFTYAIPFGFSMWG